MESFSIQECMGFGWRTFKVRPWFFVSLVVAIFLVSFITSFFQGLVVDALGKSWGELVSLLISCVVNSLIGVGYMHAFLKAHDAVMTPTLADLWAPRYFWPYLGTYLILFIAIVIGLILLIVPGIILSLMFCFATLLVVDRSQGPVDALKESARITKGHRWKLLGLLGVIALLNILGILIVFIGLFVSIPVTMLALIHAYRSLSGAHAVAVPEAAVA